MKNVLITLTAVMCLGIAVKASAQTVPEKQPPSLFYNIGPNILNSFMGWNALFMAGGVGATVCLVNTGADAKINDFAANDLNGTASNVYGVPAALLGAVVPVVIPSVLYCTADEDDYETIGAAAASGQSVIVAFTMNSLMKAVSGRVPPAREERGDTASRSRAFHVGFMNEGVFDGWPSGHSMVNMALASTLANYYPEKTWLQAASYGYALYIISAVFLGLEGNMHWFSDGVAGGLMGYAVGSTVGKSFYRRRIAGSSDGGTDGPVSEVSIIPLIFEDGAGVSFQCAFR